ncbi:hypothetical protein BC829DRAFT_403005 [Chytridium lagenaria]|nr:hypothetical protein BC829DRAFT_403005 [Chytridium lagenaria]
MGLRCEIRKMVAGKDVEGGGNNKTRKKTKKLKQRRVVLAGTKKRKVVVKGRAAALKALKARQNLIAKSEQKDEESCESRILSVTTHSSLQELKKQSVEASSRNASLYHPPLSRLCLTKPELEQIPSKHTRIATVATDFGDVTAAHAAAAALKVAMSIIHNSSSKPSNVMENSRSIKKPIRSLRKRTLKPHGLAIHLHYHTHRSSPRIGKLHTHSRTRCCRFYRLLLLAPGKLKDGEKSCGCCGFNGAVMMAKEGRDAEVKRLVRRSVEMAVREGKRSNGMLEQVKGHVAADAFQDLMQVLEGKFSSPASIRTTDKTAKGINALLMRLGPCRPRTLRRAFERGSFLAARGEVEGAVEAFERAGDCSDAKISDDARHNLAILRRRLFAGREYAAMSF